jgi:tetratricopeptide (TPR) repeat protein
MKIAAGITKTLLVLLLALSAVAAVAKEKEKNEFPNATRREPKTQISQDASKKINAAYQYIDQNKHDEAKEILQAVLDNKKSSKYELAIANTGLANIAYDQDDTAKAAAYDEAAIAIDGLDNKSHFQTIYQLAQIRIIDEQYEQSLAAIDQWFKLSGAETADAWALKGNALYRLDRFADAAEAIKHALALTDKPNTSWTQMLLASYTDAEKYDEAVATAQSLLAKDPDNKSVIQQLASIYLDMEQEPKALALLEDAYKRGLLTEEKELKQLYQMYNFLEKPKEAAAIINEGLTKGVLKPGLETYKGLADSYALAEDFDQAIDAYTKAAGFATDGEMDFQRAQLLIQEKDKFAEGKQAIQSAIAKGGLKREGSAYILLGNAEYEQGNTKAAIAAYQKARGYADSKTMAESWLKNMKAL